MKHSNKKAFSLVMALGLTIVMILLTFYILEYIIPYGRNVKGIENSTNAFYQSESNIEKGLLFMKDRGTDITQDINSGFVGSNPSVQGRFTTTSSGQLIPVSGEGNSEYSSDYNTLSLGNPVQLQVGNGAYIKWTNPATRLYLRVPNLDGNSITYERINPMTSVSLVDWQLSTSDNTLNATGSVSRIGSTDICDSLGSCSGINLSARQGRDLNEDEGNAQRFVNFYNTNCQGTASGCTLKMSVINKLESDSGNPLPYLEYKFSFNSTQPVALRYSRIKAIGRSYGFQKHLEVRVPQQTTNEGFNFTVFQ